MATGVRNRVAGGGGFGSGEHTHVHKEEKGDKARPGCPCELPWAEDTDQMTPVGGCSRISVRFQSTIRRRWCS